MAKRYSKIVHANDEKLALTNYLNYLEHPETRPNKRIQGGTRNSQRLRAMSRGHLKPFGAALPAGGTGYLINYSATSLEAFAGFEAALVSTGRLVTGAPAANSGTYFEIPKGYLPARASVFVPIGNTAEYVQSRVTRLWYLKYQGKSHSLPFGATGDAEEQEAGERAAKAALLTAGANQQYFRVSIRPESIKIPF